MLIAAAVTLVYVKKKNVTVVIDGQPTKIITFKNTLGEALKSKGISVGEKDRLSSPLNSKISKNETISIKRAVNITVTVDGKELAINSSEDTIASMLKAEGVKLNSDDKVIPKDDTILKSGTKVEIIRVEKKSITASAPVDFKTVVKNDSSLSNTQRKVIQDGKPGEKQTTDLVTYENGKEVARKLVSQVVSKNPTDKIIVQGTYPSMPVSRGGDPLPYYKVINARATAYYAVNGVGRTYTASGRLAVRSTDGYSTIAVDPSVIPFGTKMFIEHYGFAVAADSGTAILGNTIDVFFNTRAEACNWSTKYVNVYLLK